MTTGDDEDRIAYLTGEGADSLPADERADLDELRALLGSPATWAEPDPTLEDSVVAAIAAEAGRGPERARSRRLPVLRMPRARHPTLALAGLAAAVVVGATTLAINAALAAWWRRRGPR